MYIYIEREISYSYDGNLGIAEYIFTYVSPCPFSLCVLCICIYEYRERQIDR